MQYKTRQNKTTQAKTTQTQCNTRQGKTAQHKQRQHKIAQEKITKDNTRPLEGVDVFTRRMNEEETNGWIFPPVYVFGFMCLGLCLDLCLRLFVYLCLCLYLCLGLGQVPKYHCRWRKDHLSNPHIFLFINVYVYIFV